MEILVHAALAFAFAAGSAFAYLKLAKGRKDVRRESRWVFWTLLIFGLVRLLATGT